MMYEFDGKGHRTCPFFRERVVIDGNSETHTYDCSLNGEKDAFGEKFDLFIDDPDGERPVGCPFDMYPYTIEIGNDPEG